MMSLDSDNLSTALQSAREQALKPLAEQSVETLDLDGRQLADLEQGLDAAWFFGIRTGHAVMLETRTGRVDPQRVILGMQSEFQDLMERLAEDLNTTVGSTVAAWNYLGQAWIAGARFWEVETFARLIEARSGDIAAEFQRLLE